MKLMCNVQVSYRLQPNLKRKTLQSTIALGKEPNKDELFIIHFSSANKGGTKYKVNNNIEKIYTKFVNEGKTTICFKQPQHNLLIQSDHIQLKSFLKIFKLALEKSVPLKDLKLSSYSVTGFSSKDTPQRKLTITHRSNYPTKGFPRTLEALTINDISMCRFDKQILNLCNLQVLNLSGNCISELPSSLSKMNNLKELVISHNQLGKSSIRNWNWLCGKLATTLKSLDISYNEIYIIPKDIANLKELVQLNINDNNLIYVPPSIHRMKQLKFLNVSKNNLKTLPSSIEKLNLELLDISDNNFVNFSRMSYPRAKPIVKSLLEISAKIVLRQNIPFNSKLIPVMLVSYLNTPYYCYCGNAVFEKTLNKIVQFEMTDCRGSYIRTNFESIPLEYFFCSIKCFESINCMRCAMV